MADGVTLKIPALESSLAKLRAIAPTLDAELDEPLRKSAEEVADVAQRGAPRRTGRYASSIKSRKIDGNARFQDRRYVSVFTGRRVSRYSEATKTLDIKETDVKTSIAYGIFADWIWHFIEFGTIHSPAKPHLFPAQRLLRKRIAGRVKRAMKRALAGAGK